MDSSLFNRWVIAPLSVLKNLDNGDGAFAALAIAFSLYEHFIVAKIKTETFETASPKLRYQYASMDFDGLVTADDFRSFWEMYRVGIDHYFQPKNFIKGDKTKWGWDISTQKGYFKYPKIVQISPGTYQIQIDPWEFIDHVVARWSANLNLWGTVSCAQFGEIHEETTPQTVEPLFLPTAHTPSPHPVLPDNNIRYQILATGTYPSNK